MGDPLRQDEHEPFDIPDVLPLLPVRDLVVFPAQVVPLFVSREISLSAVEQALAKERLVISGVQDPGRLADLVASSLQLKAQEAQEILEQLDPVARLRGIHERLARESQLLAMQARLQSQAKEEISKTQREYYLREQLRQIQHELGERDEKAEMVAELRKKMDARGLPEHVAEEAGKELRRLEAMSLDSAESAV